MARETDLQTATRIDMVNDGPQLTLDEYKIRRNELLAVLAFLAELDQEINE